MISCYWKTRTFNGCTSLVTRHKRLPILPFGSIQTHILHIFHILTTLLVSNFFFKIVSNLFGHYKQIKKMPTCECENTMFLLIRIPDLKCFLRKKKTLIFHCIFVHQFLNRRYFRIKFSKLWIYTIFIIPTLSYFLCHKIRGFPNRR